MANTIILKRSATPGKSPTASQLQLGEIAINTYDGRIFIKKDDGVPSVVEIGGVTSVNSHSGTVVLSTTDIAEGTSQYFTTARARAAISAGTGISYSSSTGVISTSQSIATSASPTFAGLTLTGNMGITGNIVPSANNTYSLGTSTYQWKDLYVGPGTLYVNGKAVISDTSGTMTFSTDVDQNMRITTSGTGVLQLGSSTSTVNIDGTLQMGSGKRITDAAGTNVQFGNPIHMNSNKITNLGTPGSNYDAATKKYVDDTVSAISTSTISQGNSSVQVVDSGTGTVTVTVDGSTALTVSSDGVVVAGNFTVSGTTTTVNSNTIALADNIITLNSDTTGTPTQNAGIEVERGDEANVQVRWNEGSGKWTFTNDGSVYTPFATNTDGLTEGSTNLYFTNGRARTALSASTATGISYNSSTGAFSLGSIPNSALTNNNITINGASVALGGTRTLTTDDVADTSATNKYFTNAQARGAISVSGTGLAYNSSTGVISSNAASANTASTIVARDASGNFTAGTITASLSGNASTATALATARNIQGVSFDGTAAITVVTAGTGITVTGTAVAVDSTIATKSYVDSAILTKDNTDEITEGTTNLYFTTSRARSSVSAGTGISYNSTTGAISTSAIPNSSLTNSSVTVGTTAISLGASSTTLAGLTSVTSTSFVGALTGNASTATALQTARTISGTSFDGSANITLTTTGITEGTNLYYTDARARAAVSGGTGITVSAGGVIATTITQYTDALARAAHSFTAGSGAYNSTTGVITIPTTSAHVTESGNLFYTDARARAAISGSTGISYNSTTGAISSTITQYTDALARAAVSFTAGSGAYNSTTGVFTIPTNTNQLTNGAGFITGYTETSTLANVTARGATTTAALSTGALTVTGAITATGEVTAYYSDVNLKKDIVEIQDPIAKVMSLRGVTFRPNETALALGITDKEEVGVIAQEVEAVLPQLVTPSAFAGFKTVKYDKLTALLLEAVKAQQLQIDALRAEISKLGGSATTEL